MPITDALPSALLRLTNACAIALVTVLLVTACTPPTTRPGPAPVVEASESERLLAAGDYRAAADLLLKQARAAAVPERDELQLAAAAALVQGQYLDEAEQVLRTLPTVGAPVYTTRLELVRAQLELARNQIEEALLRLDTISARVPPVLEVEFHRTRASAYDLAGNPLESARERVWLDGLLPTEAERLENHRAIWRSLLRMSDYVLANLRTAPPPDALSGWMELVETARSMRDDPEQFQLALAEWRQRYPDHPVSDQFIAEMRGQLALLGVRPTELAVLLPLSGPLQEAGLAIRDGIQAAYYLSADTTRTTLRYYDTGAGSQSVRELYRRAVTDGAQLIIGPLTKEAVAELSQIDPMDVPVLALNSIGEGIFPPQLYQFSLSPEDEARQVADRAWQDGHRQALALTPEGLWGERVLQTFTQRWQELGGILLEEQRYGSDQRAYSNVVRDLLNIDASERRHQSLTRLLGQQPEFEPRRRQDADFVFLAAYPQQGRLLRPLLRFHRASKLPTYATSQIYTGVVDEKMDLDMDGVRFCDMPWTLRSEHPAVVLRDDIARLWPEREQRYTRLYAMGIDAFQLTPYLQGLSDGSFARHPGVTGDLYIDRQHQVHRDLLWSQFKRGRPTPLAPAAGIEDAGGIESDDTLEPMELQQEIMDDQPVTNTGADPRQ